MIALQYSVDFRSPGEGNGNPLHYSCLENPMDGEAWWATVHGVSDFPSAIRQGESAKNTHMSPPA